MLSRSDWIESTGGPLLLAPRLVLAGWGGVDLSVEDSTTDDYCRACSCPLENEIGTIAIKSKFAVVVGGEPNMTALLKGASGGDLFLLRWRWAESERSLLSAVLVGNALLSLSYVCSDSIDINAEEYWLFDSAVAGSAVNDYRQVSMDKGRYFIETASFKPSDELYVLIHRLRREQ
jgi:hypothetical protein